MLNCFISVSIDGDNQMNAYRLADFEITERYGTLLWKAHSGFGSTRTGKCFIEGNILFLSPHFEINEASCLKNEFLDHLRTLPKWDRTKYYCTRFEIHECKIAITSRKHKQAHFPVASDQRLSNFAISSDKVLLQADKKAATDDEVKSGHFSEQQQDDFEIFLQNQGMGLPRVSRVVAKGYDVVKSSLKKVRFWGLRGP